MPDMVRADRPVSHKVFRNTLFNISGKACQIVIAIFLTPYIVHRLGVERYGILAILGAITGYTGLLDIGVGASFGRFIAEFRASRRDEKIGEVIGVGVVFYGAIGMIITAAVFFSLGLLIDLFKIPPYLYNDACVVFMIGAIVFVVTNTFNVFAAVQVGLQRMDLSNTIAITTSVVNAIGAVFVIQRGYGLQGLMINAVIICAITTAANVFAAYVLIPDIMRSRMKFSKEMFRRLFSFGYRMQLVRIGGIMTTQIDKILIASLLSIGLVTFFQLGLNIILFTASMAGLLVSALMPAFTQIVVEEGEAAATKAYLKSVKYVSFALVPLFAFVMIYASGLMNFWMGHPSELSARVIQILAVSWMFNSIAQVALSLCIAINKPQLMAGGSIIMVMMNIILSFAFIKLFGFFGAAWGGMIAVGTGTAYILFRLHKTMHIAQRRFAAAVTPCIFMGFIAACFTAGLARLLPWHISTGDDRVQQAILLFVHGAIFLSAYLTGIYASKFFHRNEFMYFKQLIFPAVRFRK